MNSVSVRGSMTSLSSESEPSPCIHCIHPSPAPFVHNVRQNECVAGMHTCVLACLLPCSPFLSGPDTKLLMIRPLACLHGLNHPLLLLQIDLQSEQRRGHHSKFLHSSQQDLLCLVKMKRAHYDDERRHRLPSPYPLLRAHSEGRTRQDKEGHTLTQAKCRRAGMQALRLRVHTSTRKSA